MYFYVCYAKIPSSFYNHHYYSRSPSKLGPYEKKLIEECLLYALVIVIKTLPERPNYIQVWVKCLDPSQIYYAGKIQDDYL
jgi:hypothetical protein